MHDASAVIMSNAEKAWTLSNEQTIATVYPVSVLVLLMYLFCLAPSCYVVTAGLLMRLAAVALHVPWARGIDLNLWRHAIPNKAAELKMKIISTANKH